jgi:hypothetical protein
MKQPPKKPGRFRADLSTMNLEQGQPVLTLNPDDISLSGNVSERFEPDAAPY